MKPRGTVYLVGAGPGDAQLLTLRGAALLGRADVVLYDSLVNPALLDLAPPSAEVVSRARESDLTQEQLTALMIQHARAGKTVVRLKGGDPYIFGRGGEEAEALAAAKIAFEVVPGVSSVSAVPNYAGIPLTHREHCSSFTVITGHDDPTKPDSGIDWNHFARGGGTKIILMGAERIGQLAAHLLQLGMAPKTPAAMIRWGTTGQQQTITGTLADIAQKAAEAKLTAPVVTVLGEVVGLRSRLGWFERRPLFGQRVVVTRARNQAAGMAQALRERGAEVIELPTIKLAPPSVHEPLVEAMAGLNAYDWIVFTSANGVTAFFEYFFRAFEDMRDIGGVRIAAVGAATAAKLRELHLKVDLTPREYVATEIASALKKYESMENLRVMLLRAEKATPELPKLLEDLGAIVDDVPCYQTVAETEDRNGAVARLNSEGADWITFTSGSTVEHFHARLDLPGLLKRHPGIRLASIGPETTKAIKALGLSPALEASVHTAEGLVAALEKA
jgi:uroporphyrinogen III methyltransferase/synthase